MMLMLNIFFILFYIIVFLTVVEAHITPHLKDETRSDLNGSDTS